jgi:hypothetical protein
LALPGGAEEQAVQVPPKSKLGEALGHLLRPWNALTTSVRSGAAAIDNSTTERDLRALTIGRKNWLFVGSQEAGPRAAILYTVMANRQAFGWSPPAQAERVVYLRDALEHLAKGDTDPANLLPKTTATAHPESIRTYRIHKRKAASAAKRGSPRTPPGSKAGPGQARLAQAAWKDRGLALLRSSGSSTFVWPTVWLKSTMERIEERDSSTP